jgi:hypothetical protein
MIVFKEQQRYIAWHTDAAAASRIIQFNVHASKFIACHIVLDAMEFLEDIKEIGEVFEAHIFYAKVVNDEAQLDGSPFVVPVTGCLGRFIKTFYLETGSEKIVIKDACLWKFVATLVDFEVNPSVPVQTCELVFVNEFLWNVQDFDANVFRLGHGRVKVEVLKVNGAKSCTFLQEYTVEEKL